VLVPDQGAVEELSPAGLTLCGAKRVNTGAELGVELSGTSAVLADQPSDGLSAVDPGGHVDHFAGIVHRRAGRMALMRAVLVEMTVIPGREVTTDPVPLRMIRSSRRPSSSSISRTHTRSAIQTG
jgi:hypothetical protein